MVVVQLLDYIVRQSYFCRTTPFFKRGLTGIFGVQRAGFGHFFWEYTEDDFF